MEEICGIYSITNIINGKIYIGSSCNIDNRWTVHKRMLNKGIHHSYHLQQAWNKYGKDNFIFEVIERCNKDDLLIREQYYIDLYNSADSYYGYNISPIAGKPNITDEQRKLNALISSEKLKGENNWCNIYSEKQILSLIEDLKKGIYSYSQLSEKHNISYDIVTSVAYHTSWKYLTKDIVFPKPKLESRKNVLLTEEDVKEIINLILQGKGNDEISKLYNTAPHTISDIRNHKTWKYLTTDMIFPRVRRNKGFGNEKSKLTETDVKEIKTRLQNHDYKSLQKLASEYSVTTTVIYNIKIGKTYNYVNID